MFALRRICVTSATVFDSIREAGGLGELGWARQNEAASRRRGRAGRRRKDEGGGLGAAPVAVACLCGGSVPGIGGAGLRRR